MKSLFFALLTGVIVTGCCSTTPQGGTSYSGTVQGSSDTAEAVDYGQAVVEHDSHWTDYGRGSDRFSQDSSRMLPGKEPDVRTFRQ
jgi:hypothetical protein